METYPEWLLRGRCRAVEAPAVRMPKYLRHRRLRELDEMIRVEQAAIARIVWGSSPRRVNFHFSNALQRQR